MRRAATAAFATTVLAVSVATIPTAGAQDPTAAPVECTTLGLLTDPACLLIATVEDALAPATEALAPSEPAPAPEPLPVPGTTSSSPEGGSAPAPAPAPAPSNDTYATSTGSPTAADLGAAPASTRPAASAQGGSRARVPSVPSGATLELSPLGLPTFSFNGTEAASADAAAAEVATETVVLPAAAAAAAMPDDSKTTAVAFAVSMLLLAGGLLVDQLRKARQPIQL
jgi:hypothetical protein